MLAWLLKLIPAEYKWDVAAKEVVHGAVKGTAILLAYGKVGKFVGSHLTPDQVTQVQAGSAVLVGAILAGVHDWAAMKWPNASWL